MSAARRARGRVLVTGAAGFIGAHACAALAHDGLEVVGCDSFNGYYDTGLKRDRVTALLAPLDIECRALDLAWPGAAAALVRETGPFQAVVHLAAQAGVRHSLRDPPGVVEANVTAFVSLLEACRAHAVGHVVYASSSSVYGARSGVPFAEGDALGAPTSVYAATKQANEALAHVYASAYGMALTGLRFFTVYGPWGRPDMAYFEFARAIRRGEAVELFEGGRPERDFTYVDDAVEALRRIVARGPQPARAEVFNVGQRRPVSVAGLLASIERALELDAIVRHAPAPPGDVPVTCADPRLLQAAIGAWLWRPLDAGLRAFVDWLAWWDADRQPGLRQAS